MASWEQRRIGSSMGRDGFRPIWDGSSARTRSASPAAIPTCTAWAITPSCAPAPAGSIRLAIERQCLRRVWNGTAYVNDYRVTESWRRDGLDRVTEHSNGSLAGTQFNSTGPARETYAYAYDA